MTVSLRKLGQTVWLGRLALGFWVSVAVTLTGLSAWGAAATTITVAPHTKWATPCYILDSGRPGPVVMVVGGMYGDEPAGAWAASEIRHWPVTHGKLVILPRANVPGLRAGTANTPGDAASADDLDRIVERASQGGAQPDSPAAAMWQLAVDVRPTWLVELREGSVNKVAPARRPTTSSSGASRSEAAAKVVLQAVNATIAESPERFHARELPDAGGLAVAVRRQFHAQALVLQTENKIDQALALRIRRQRIMLHALLEHLDMIDAPRTPVDLIADREEDGSLIRLAVFAGPGTRKGMHHLLKEMEQLPHSVVLPVGAEEINAGVLQHCNVILFPGGSSTRQGVSLGDIDRRTVRDFIQRGGGYVGICAGAFLATTDWHSSLKILDAKPYSTDWKRGRGVVQMELTPEGRNILGTDRLYCDVRYHNGPILVPAQSPDLPGYQPLAVYHTEVAEYGPKGVMLGTPAIVASEFGKGRVLCFSPHPDQTKGLEEMVRRGVRWTARSG